DEEIWIQYLIFHLYGTYQDIPEIYCNLCILHDCIIPGAYESFYLFFNMKPLLLGCLYFHFFGLFSGIKSQWRAQVGINKNNMNKHSKNIEVQNSITFDLGVVLVDDHLLNNVLSQYAEIVLFKHVNHFPYKSLNYLWFFTNLTHHFFGLFSGIKSQCCEICCPKTLTSLTKKILHHHFGLFSGIKSQWEL
ncbi:hypothetical protein ACJX0J_012205, partial [Zea mays]